MAGSPYETEFDRWVREREEERLRQSYMNNQQQSGGGPSPSMAMQFIPEGGAAAGGSQAALGGAEAGSGIASGWAAAETLPVATSMGATSGGAAATGGAAGAGAAGGGSAASGLGGAAVAAAPWAALAAVIAGNEVWANKEGRRPGDFGDQVVDGFTGKSLERDMDALGDKIGGPIGKMVETGGKLGNLENSYDAISDASKWLLKPWEWF
jgi:hypothetical protein